jgi:hypothetical protein
MRRTVTFLALSLAMAAPAGAGETSRTESAGLRYVVSRAWTRVPAPSDVRAAQYTIPRSGGDTEDGELILFFFGPSKGGSADENLTRWHGQFTQPDGRPSRDAGEVRIKTVRGLRLTALDLAGTYVGGQMPGGQKTPPKPGYRMLAAIIEGEGGPWFFKAVGPAATIAQAKGEFDRMLDSVDVHR